VVNRVTAFLWRTVKPPYGCDIRRYVAWSLLGFGLIRLLHIPAMGNTALSWLPLEAYGGVKIAIGIALLATNGKRRLTWYGYGSAIIAVIFCGMAAADSVPVFNGVWIYLLLVWALLGEVTSRHECT
jgi:hypothetical protein